MMMTRFCKASENSKSIGEVQERAVEDTSVVVLNVLHLELFDRLQVELDELEESEGNTHENEVEADVDEDVRSDVRQAEENDVRR